MITATWKDRVIPACSDCGTTAGTIPQGATRPVRCDGSRYGFGPLCATCRAKHYGRYKRRLDAKRRARAAQQKLSRAERQASRQHEKLIDASQLLVLIGCRHGRPRYRFARSCDLCGVGTSGRLFDGAEYDLEGKICRQCRNELNNERAWKRYLALAEVVTRHEYQPGRETCGRFNATLEVLSPGFTAADLTPRAYCRVLIAQEKRRVIRREPRRVSA